ncbi:dihydrofolate reductase [Dolosigranulum pigrum]|uniref:Dihydrofolate reductase n=1 Tax=Dolosigranulum pigrum TaxID=29394 RepID=A0A516GIK4_9LACT|nr:dihydrofolate reductase [Dolosigranulum pigrum]QDO91351.1 dihydrofolate reductase [Dolosigranulum pigrum]
MLTFVWIEDENQLIGQANQLPWHLPADLKHFKAVTVGDAVLMGRKTYEALPIKPLPNRRNIILTRNKDYIAPGAEVFHSKEAVMSAIDSDQQTLHIIGGGEIFKLFIDEVDELYQTIIEGDFEGDTYFPTLDFSEFELLSEKEGVVDEANRHPHTFYHYRRKNT